MLLVASHTTVWQVGRFFRKYRPLFRPVESYVAFVLNGNRTDFHVAVFGLCFSFVWYTYRYCSGWLELFIRSSNDVAVVPEMSIEIELDLSLSYPSYPTGMEPVINFTAFTAVQVGTVCTPHTPHPYIPPYRRSRVLLCTKYATCTTLNRIP